MKMWCFLTLLGFHLGLIILRPRRPVVGHVTKQTTNLFFCHLQENPCLWHHKPFCQTKKQKKSDKREDFQILCFKRLLVDTVRNKNALSSHVQPGYTLRKNIYALKAVLVLSTAQALSACMFLLAQLLLYVQSRR